MSNASILISNKNDYIIKTKDFEFSPNTLGLGNEILLCLKKHEENIAQIDIQSGQIETYEQILKKSITAAINLKNQEITSEDIIALHTTSNSNTLIALIASILIGAKTTFINPLHSSDDVKSMIETIKPRLIFVTEESEDKIKTIKSELDFEMLTITFGQNKEMFSFENLVNPLANDDDIENFASFQVDKLSETTILIFSSGKSGVPKAKCFNHDTILSQAARLANSRPKGSNFLIYSGLDWVDTHINLIANILSGNTWFITPEFDPSTVEEYLNKYDIHHLTLCVLDSLKLLRYWKPSKLNTPKLKTITIFSKKLSAEIINDIQKIFYYPIKINNTYNLSEIYGPCFAPNNLQPDSVGVPIEGFSYKIIDPKTNKICSPYKKGEICILSNYSMVHCYDEESNEYFDSDGFLKTGDLGYYDDEFNFFIIDPLNEILTFNTHISPTKLAQILYQHPAVKIAGIFGIPSKDGDIVTGVVVKSENYPDITEAELIQFVNDKVEDFEKISGGIMFIDEQLVPFTPTGKVRRFLLQKAIFEDLDDLEININLL